MPYESEILKVKLDNQLEYWDIALPKERGKSPWTIMYYHWCEAFDIEGIGYLFGDPTVLRIPKEAALKESFPKVESVLGIDLEGGDINWDVTTKVPSHLRPANFVFLSQVLEHVVDPIVVLRNALTLLKKNGLLFVGCPRFGFKYHPFPIDCYRFSPDAFKEWTAYLGITMLDFFLTKNNCYGIYRK